MPLIQFDCPEDVNKNLKKYMLEHDIVDKREAVIDVLRGMFK